MSENAFTQRQKDKINNNLYQAGLSLQKTIREVNDVYSKFGEPECLSTTEAVLLCDSLVRALKEMVELNGRSASPSS